MTEQLDLFEVYSDDRAHELTKDCWCAPEVEGVVVGDIEDFDLGTACSIDAQDECESCQ
jgi:hypothetical protein